MKLHHWQPSLPERYTRMSEADLAEAIARRRAELGDRLVILGHHYQTDEVIQHADFTGDSFKLSQLAAEQVERRGAEYVIFCGVHFMAESADLLTPDGVSVILPDLSAGCSMADMAEYEDVEEAWDLLHEALEAEGWTGRIVPVTYMNSSAAIKAFVGERGGAVCTSSNADAVFEWALSGGAEGGTGVWPVDGVDDGRDARPTDSTGQRPARPLDNDVKILFLPDQHLGRNTAAACGFDVQRQTCVYDPRRTNAGEPLGGLDASDLPEAKVILWAGHCSVHKLFRAEHCDKLRRDAPETNILVHPECCKEVVDRADSVGSTEHIIRTIRDAEPGSAWAVGTEVHLVNRLANEAAKRGVHVRILSDCQCLCTTMFRIDQPHLLWALDNLAQGKIVNQISVHPEVREHALTALDRMLSLTEQPAIAK